CAPSGQQQSGIELRVHLGQHAGRVSGFEAEKNQIAIGSKLAVVGDVDAGKLGGQRFQLALGEPDSVRTSMPPMLSMPTKPVFIVSKTQHPKTGASLTSR